jgi:hypothetical protein
MAVNRNDKKRGNLMVYNVSGGIATGGGVIAPFAGLAVAGYVVLAAALLAAAFGVWRLTPKRNKA